MPKKDYCFIADVHLKPNQPEKIALFCKIISEHIKNTDLFILGDFFDAWLGDDTIAPWLQPIKDCFKQIKTNGSNIYLMPGNHDFMLGQKLAEHLGVELIKDPYILLTNSQRILLTHGDQLCADDQKYQRIRPIIQNKITKKALAMLSVSNRQKLANKLQGRGQKKNIDPKLMQSMLTKFNCQSIIHGHIHHFSETNTSLSLCPWDQKIILSKLINSKFQHLEIN